MDIAKRAEGFREAITQLGPRGRTTPYPRNLREEAVGYAQERRAQGATWRSIAQELGLGVDSLTHWARGSRGSKKEAAFRQVKLKPSEGPAKTGGTVLVVHGPGGVRVEGLDVPGLAELLRRLS